MKTGRWFWFVYLFLFLEAQNTTTLCPDGKPCLIYEVQKKESIYGISKKFNTMQELILKYNPDIQKYGLKVGQKIFIPVSPSASESVNNTPKEISPLPEFYVVKKGDTFYSIQKQFRLTRQEILDMNPDLNPDKLPEGTVIRLKKEASGQVKDIVEQYKRRQNITEVPQEVSISAGTVIPDFPVKNEYTIAVLLPVVFHEQALMQTYSDWEKNFSFPDEASRVADFVFGLEYGLKTKTGKDLLFRLQIVDEPVQDSVFEKYWKKYSDTFHPDLIIGPYYPEHVRLVVSVGREKQIPLVSPWVLHNKFLYENPLAFKFITSQQTMAENLARYISDSLLPLNYKPVCFQASLKDPKEHSYVRMFKQSFIQRCNSHGRADSMPVVRTMSELKKILENNPKTAVITMSQNKVLMTDFITQLYLASQKKDVVLCMMKSLLEYENIDQDYLNYFQWTFPSFVEMEPVRDSAFLAESRKVFHTVPSEIACMGKALGEFLYVMLSEKGLNFLKEKEICMKDTFVRMKFIRPDLQTGMDNVGCYIYKVKDYRFVKTGWR